jgi:hypothetical protein
MNCAHAASLILLARQWFPHHILVRQVLVVERIMAPHQGQGPTVMARLRDAAVSLLQRAGVRQITARLRYHRQHPAAAVALLMAPPPTHA